MTISSSSKPIAILGAGAWGTALAIHLATQKQIVNLWSMVSEEIADLKKDRENKRFLPGFALPSTLHPMEDLAESINGVEDIIIAMPSVAYKKTLKFLKTHSHDRIRILSATKGLEESGDLLHKIILRELGENISFAIISGPSFAREVAALQPTSLMVASKDPQLIEDTKTRFQTQTMRLFATNDIIGVEIGAIIKNVVAIAVGIAEGLQFGTNAKSAIITQGLQDMVVLGKKLEARIETLIGLAGAGDLILTCTDNQSRNRRFGLSIGAGKTIAEAEKEIGQVVEGKNNLELLLKLAKRHQLELIIPECLGQLLNNKISATEAISLILAGKL